MNPWEKYKSMPVQAKASIWYTICSFFQSNRNCNSSYATIHAFHVLPRVDEYLFPMVGFVNGPCRVSIRLSHVLGAVKNREQ